MAKRELVDMTRLAELKARGYHCRVIARILGVSPETVQTIVGTGVTLNVGPMARTEAFRKCA